MHKRHQRTSADAAKPLQIELDRDVIADLEATDGDTDAIRGGGRRTSECRAATNAT